MRVIFPPPIGVRHIGTVDQSRQLCLLAQSEDTQLIGECHTGIFLGGLPPAAQVGHGRRALLQLSDCFFLPGGAAQPGRPATRIGENRKGDLQPVAAKSREMQAAAQFPEQVTRTS